MKAFSVDNRDLDAWHRTFHPTVERLERRDVQLQHEMTFAEIAAVLNCSQQAVQQTQRNALKKCRRWCAEHGLQLADLLNVR